MLGKAFREPGTGLIDMVACAQSGVQPLESVDLTNVDVFVGGSPRRDAGLPLLRR